MKCACGGSLSKHPSIYGYLCSVCGAICNPEGTIGAGFAAWLPDPKPTRSVWYRTRSVSYTREMNVEDLNEDGTIKGDPDGRWERWQ